MITVTEIACAGLAAVAAGLINALAGGGTLVSFPALVALGVPPVAANVTNTVALCPGYLGGAFEQRKDLVGQARRLLIFIPVGILGGLLGGILLLWSGESIFRVLVPFLILLATGMLTVQDRVRIWINRRTVEARHPAVEGREAVIPVGLAAVYGGFFGPGLSVIILSALALAIDDTLTRLNALKQCISLGVNVAAAALFVFSGLVVWPMALVMAIGALSGGVLGGRLASRIDPATLKSAVILIGFIVGIVLLVQLVLIPG